MTLREEILKNSGVLNEMPIVKKKVMDNIYLDISPVCTFSIHSNNLEIDEKDIKKISFIYNFISKSKIEISDTRQFINDTSINKIAAKLSYFEDYDDPIKHVNFNNEESKKLFGAVIRKISNDDYDKLIASLEGDKNKKDNNTMIEFIKSLRGKN